MGAGASGGKPSDAGHGRRSGLTAITGAGSSAPGIDEEPYELYQAGAGFVAALMGQAHYAAAHSDGLLQLVLGGGIDLLVWIPKVDNAETPNEWRPLQLPPASGGWWREPQRAGLRQPWCKHARRSSMRCLRAQERTA